MLRHTFKQFTPRLLPSCAASAGPACHAGFASASPGCKFCEINAVPGNLKWCAFGLRMSETFSKLWCCYRWTNSTRGPQIAGRRCGQRRKRGSVRSWHGCAHKLLQLKLSLFAAVIDESSQTLFLTEMFRGLNLTLKAFFDRKVTVSLLLTVTMVVVRYRTMRNVCASMGCEAVLCADQLPF